MYARNRILPVLVLAALAVGTTSAAAPAAPAAAGELKISNFRQGLVRSTGIYKEGAVLPNIINAICTVAGADRQCNRHAFEFDFESPEDLVELQCMTTTSEPGNNVTPSAVLAKATNVARWSMYLEGRSGHYVRPQFSYGIQGRRYYKGTACTYQGKTVLEFSFTFVPEL